MNAPKSKATLVSVGDVIRSIGRSRESQKVLLARYNIEILFSLSRGNRESHYISQADAILLRTRLKADGGLQKSTQAKASSPKKSTWTEFNDGDAKAKLKILISDFDKQLRLLQELTQRIEVRTPDLEHQISDFQQMITDFKSAQKAKAA
jgi:hypothetical protein